MSFQSPTYPAGILRQSVVGHEGEWVKMFDPPTVSPPTPELVSPTNPVPEVMRAAGFQGAPVAPHTINRDLMTPLDLVTWDNRANDLHFFLIHDPDNPATSNGNYPAATVRVPRGAVFHGRMDAANEHHTIHWHGIEPTPINDGVGHCSMELGRYTYQWQPNFMGTYFYHCHRNTVQHFEFGLFGALLIDAPDAFFASCATDPGPGGVITLNSTPIGNGRPEIGAGTPAQPQFPQGRRRTAANTSMFPQFPGFNSNPLDTPDPQNTAVGGQNTLNLPSWMLFQTDPHAMTIPYDVEALWVPDDRDSNWSDNAQNMLTTFPVHGDQPGVNDLFHENAGTGGFFAFNQFESDYYFITGVPVPGARVDRGGTGVGTINPAGAPPTGGGLPGGTIPPQLMSGVSGVQVAINAQVNQTILIRVIQGAYNTCQVTLPVDAVIISVDGRALGVPPYGQYNHAFLLPANTPVRLSVARRAEALVRVSSPISSFATIKFFDTRSENPVAPGNVLFTARIPFNIGTPAGTRTISGTVVDSQNGQPIMGVQLNLTGAANTMAITDASGRYTFTGLADGVYTIAATKPGFRFFPPTRTVAVSGANQPGQVFRGRSL